MMTNPPRQKKIHIDSINTSIRIPRALHAELQEAASRQARPLITEILSRLQSSPWDDLRRQNEEIKHMLRLLLSRDRD